MIREWSTKDTCRIMVEVREQATRLLKAQSRPLSQKAAQLEARDFVACVGSSGEWGI
jgi:hypothetical protein